MSKTPFSDKCYILATLWLHYREDAKKNEAWNSFFTYNDVALPMSYVLSEEIVMPSEDGEAERLIDETWGIFCDYIEIDPNGKYETLQDTFDASKRPPLEPNDE